MLHVRSTRPRSMTMSRAALQDRDRKRIMLKIGAAAARRAQGTAALLRLRRGRLLRRAGADRLVDHLPDLLVELVLLPDAVRGTEQDRRYRHQPDRPAHRRIDPLVTPKADAHPALSGSEDHRQRVADPQQLAPQALLARLHHRAVAARAVDLPLKLLRPEVIRQRPGELLRRDRGAIDPLDVQRRPAGTSRTALLFGHFPLPPLLAPGCRYSVTKPKIAK